MTAEQQRPYIHNTAFLTDALWERLEEQMDNDVPFTHVIPELTRAELDELARGAKPEWTWFHDGVHEFFETKPTENFTMSHYGYDKRDYSQFVAMYLVHRWQDDENADKLLRGSDAWQKSHYITWATVFNYILLWDTLDRTNLDRLVRLASLCVPPDVDQFFEFAGRLDNQFMERAYASLTTDVHYRLNYHRLIYNVNHIYIPVGDLQMRIIRNYTLFKLFEENEYQPYLVRII
jgi:hypothetical protein